MPSLTAGRATSDRIRQGLPSRVIPIAEPRVIPALWRRTKDLVKAPLYWLYQRRLERELSTWTIPRHIGFIMDGNRRFARANGLATVSEGHLKGAEKLWDVLHWCYEAGVTVVTVWSFSIDNFQRDTQEVEALLALFEEKTRELVNHEEVHAKEVRVRYLGQLGLLPESLQEAIGLAEQATANYSRYQLNIAMAYGGRQEIADAFRRYLRERAREGETLESVIEGFDERSIEPYLYTCGLPEPDLIFRTSGEIRLGGFLMWQSAYSEFYFCDTNWPALRKIDLLRALRSYNYRQLRMGR